MQRVLNTSAQPVYLRRHVNIAYLSPVDLNDEFNVAAISRLDDKCMHFDSSHQAPLASPVKHEQKVVELQQRGLNFAQTKANLTSEQFTALIDLLYESKTLFISDDSELGEANLPPIHIYLSDEKPVRARPHKLPPHMDAELNSQLLKMKRDGILEDSCSPFSSPVLLVRKAGKPGNPPAYRLVTDFRNLNKKILPEFHVLPSIDQARSMIGQEKACYFSVCDNKSGYHALKLAEDSRPYTAISSSTKHYQYPRLPMGLSISSSRYALALTSLLQDILDTNLALIYIWTISFS